MGLYSSNVCPGSKLFIMKDNSPKPGIILFIMASVMVGVGAFMKVQHITYNELVIFFGMALQLAAGSVLLSGWLRKNAKR